MQINLTSPDLTINSYCLGKWNASILCPLHKIWGLETTSFQTLHSNAPMLSEKHQAQQQKTNSLCYDYLEGKIPSLCWDFSFWSPAQSNTKYLAEDGWLNFTGYVGKHSKTTPESSKTVFLHTNCKKKNTIWTSFALKNSLSSSWYGFNKMLETFLWDSAPSWHDCITAFLQICQLHIHVVSLVLHQIPKVFSWIQMCWLWRLQTFTELISVFLKPV